jgi:hypothetical protein
METTRATTSTGTVASAGTVAARRTFDNPGDLNQPGTIVMAGTVAAPPPLTPAEVVAALDPGLVNSITALRADLENWIAAGRALLDRARDHIVDAARK